MILFRDNNSPHLNKKNRWLVCRDPYDAWHYRLYYIECEEHIYLAATLSKEMAESLLGKSIIDEIDDTTSVEVKIECRYADAEVQ